MARYHGNNVFKALITAVNEYGEIRIQFHVVTDAHEQMSNALSAFEDTVQKLGHAPLQLLCTDKPTEDGKYFCQNIPSLRTSSFNHKLHNTSTVVIGQNTYAIEEQYIDYLTNIQDINTKTLALRQSLPETDRVLSLDAEWDTTKNASGMISNSGHKVSVIQIGYRMNGITRVLVIKTASMTSLPIHLQHLFEDYSITFTGRQVGGDVSKIGKDFNINEQSKYN